METSWSFGLLNWAYTRKVCTPSPALLSSNVSKTRPSNEAGRKCSCRRCRWRAGRSSPRADRHSPALHRCRRRRPRRCPRCTSTADTGCVELVAIAVTIADRDVGTSAVVDGAWAVADPTAVHRARAIAGVDVGTDAIRIHVGGTVAAADTGRVELVAVAITIAGRDVGASAVRWRLDRVSRKRPPSNAVAASSQTPSASASEVQVPPQTPRASVGCRCSRSHRPECRHPHS